MKHLLVQKANEEEAESFDWLSGGIGLVFGAIGASVLTGISVGLIASITYIVFVKLTGIVR